MRFIKISILFYLFVYGLLISMLMYLEIIKVNFEIMAGFFCFTFFSFIFFFFAWKKFDLLKKINIATVIAYLIPLLILGYVVYLNWLPFGYEKTYVLDVGASVDIDSS